jgi:hypothetical protein
MLLLNYDVDIICTAKLVEEEVFHKLSFFIKVSNSGGCTGTCIT